MIGIEKVWFSVFLRELENNRRKFYVGPIPEKVPGKPTPLFTSSKCVAIFVFYEQTYEMQNIGEVIWRPYEQ